MNVCAYHCGMARLILGDCLQKLRLLKSDSVHAVITSPPYDALRTYRGMPAFTFEAFSGIAKELSRVIKPGG